MKRAVWCVALRQRKSSVPDSQLARSWDVLKKLFLILDRLGMEFVNLCDALSLERRDAAMCG